MCYTRDMKTATPLTKPLITNILNADSSPTLPLVELLSKADIVHDGTLGSIVKETQRAWVQKSRPQQTTAAPKERWEIEKEIVDEYEAQRAELLPLLQKLGFVDEIKPTKNAYTYGVIMGATLTDMRVRIAYAIHAWQQGIRYEKIIFLLGERPADSIEDSIELLLDKNNGILPIKNNWRAPHPLPATEGTIAEALYAQADLPRGMDTLPVEFIRVPMIENADKTVRRPTTGDTIIKWLATNPAPGSVLAFSNQPYCAYQESVVNTFLPTTFEVETVGQADAYKTNAPTNIILFLDNLGRTLYQELQRKK